MLYRMLFANEPFASFEEAADATSVPLPCHLNSVASKEAVELVLAMLTTDHKSRITVQEVRPCSHILRTLLLHDHCQVTVWQLCT